MRDTEIANRLRAYGLSVVEVNGWQSRGSSAFDPKGSLDHHTAGAASGNAPSLGVCINGRKDLPGPLCHVLLARDNTCYVIASGKANHAGSGGWRGLSGNSSVYGLERENTGTEPWRPDQHLVAATVHAALLDNPALVPNICRHAEWTRRKPDSHSVNGNDLRALVNAVYERRLHTPPPPPPPAAPAAPPPVPVPVPGASFLAGIAAAARNKPTLRIGDSGAAVKDLQNHLNREMNNALSVDGSFGTRTENVLRLYQKSRGLEADGVAGFLTWSHLLAEAFN